MNNANYQWPKKTHSKIFQYIISKFLRFFKLIFHLWTEFPKTSLKSVPTFFGGFSMFPKFSIFSKFKTLCKTFFWTFSYELPQEVPKIVCLFMFQNWLDSQTYWKRNDF